MAGACICDFCRKEVWTWVDGATTLGGKWANMCLACYKRYGVGLGVGVGQLIVEGKVTKGGRNTGG